jgi:hypothetical protein
MVSGHASDFYLLLPDIQQIERKLVDHAEGAMNKRTATISDTVRSYNARCKEMKELILKKKAPLNAVAPQPLDPKTLYSLDIDDALWQDSGLEEGEGSHVPSWLGDDATRKGIKAWLSLNRSVEEIERLKQERINMQTWLREEWQRLKRATVTYGGE